MLGHELSARAGEGCQENEIDAAGLIAVMAGDKARQHT